MLSVYRTVLHNPGCESLLFEFPASALESVKKEKPDIIISDLNMPEITGIDMTKEIRKRYGKEELPIVMATTQDESRDCESSLEAGVNDIMRKPFTEKQVGTM